jgi:GNAT superfamily N-acetyltransferase
MWNPEEPETVYVGATGVDPEHRGHALGKWLKAVMTLRVMDERPQVTSIRTGNADSNDAMLGINKEMGYVPFISQTVWEIATADAEKWLSSRGVVTPQV